MQSIDRHTPDRPTIAWLKRILTVILVLCSDSTLDAIPLPDVVIDKVTDDAIIRGLEFLQDQQETDGSFRGVRFGGNVGVCALAGMAFVSRGSTPSRGPYGDNAARIVDYLVEHATDGGLIQNAEAASYGPMYGHGYATLYLCEVYGTHSRRDLRSVIHRAVGLIVQSQNDEGGWRYRPDSRESDVSVTICQMMALRAARDAGFDVPPQTVQRCVDYIVACQNDDGGFRYQRDASDIASSRSEFARSAAGLVTLYSAGIYDGEIVTRARNYLQQMRQSARDGPLPYYYYGHYYAMQAILIRPDDLSAPWYDAVRNELLAARRPDGSWASEAICPEYATAMAVLILQMPETYLPILQR